MKYKERDHWSHQQPRKDSWIWSKKVFVDFNEVDHVIEMEFLFKDKALVLLLSVILQTEVEKLQENG